jgi:hypothetical protein
MVIHCKNIGGTVVEPILFFELLSDGVKATVACEGNSSRSIAFVAFLCPVYQCITSSQNCIHRDNLFGGILTIITWLIVHQAIGECEWKETPFLYNSHLTRMTPRVVATKMG